MCNFFAFFSRRKLWTIQYAHRAYCNHPLFKQYKIRIACFVLFKYPPLLEAIQWTFDLLNIFLTYMCVDERGLDVVVTQ